MEEDEITVSSKENLVGLLNIMPDNVVIQVVFAEEEQDGEKECV